MSKPTPTPAASLAYADGQDRIREAILTLQLDLGRHAANQKRNTEDWGYPGDLGRVLTLIEEASRFIGGGKGG